MTSLLKRTSVLVIVLVICSLLQGSSPEPIRSRFRWKVEEPPADPGLESTHEEQPTKPPATEPSPEANETDTTPPKKVRPPSLPPPPPVPPERKPAAVNPPPPPPLPAFTVDVDGLTEDAEMDAGDGTDEGLYGEGMLEGDIVPSSAGRNAVSDPSLKWPVGALVFKVDDSVESKRGFLFKCPFDNTYIVLLDELETRTPDTFSLINSKLFSKGCPDSPQCEILMKAMNHYHKRACIRFKEWTGEPNSVNIFFNADSSGSCWSSVGRTGEGEQALSLGERCWYLGIVIHELAHAIGFWHEMNRPDRDEWIWVYWENIIPGYQSAFDKNEPSTVNTLGEAFDYKSIMMYDEYAFSKDGVSATLQAKQDGTIIGPIWKKKGLSDSDIRRLHRLYQCQGKQNENEGFPYDIHCDFNYHQCGYKNGGSAVWNWRNVNATDGYVYAEYEEGGETTGFLQSINFHPLEAVSGEDENSVGVLGCLRFWYFIDSSEPAELMVRFKKHMTQLAYDPDKVFELWEDGNATTSWTHVDIPLYVSRPFKLIFVSNFDETAISGIIALDDIELLYSPCLEEPEDNGIPTKPPPGATTKPQKPLVSKPTMEPLPNYCPEYFRHKVKPRQEL
ncbi:meprin A subunit beta-like [Ischnura elegans]|uniref:meprin A subunit beta-like n=1 Tax=Ischnura elegans TaxID=197161 RepID=UPI001ED88AC2|nr:meprin A subunit beta-like [Ischnura elegans]